MPRMTTQQLLDLLTCKVAMASVRGKAQPVSAKVIARLEASLAFETQVNQWISEALEG